MPRRRTAWAGPERPRRPNSTPPRGRRRGERRGAPCRGGRPAHRSRRATGCRRAQHPQAQVVGVRRSPTRRPPAQGCTASASRRAPRPPPLRAACIGAAIHGVDDPVGVDRCVEGGPCDGAIDGGPHECHVGVRAAVESAAARPINSLPSSTPGAVGVGPTTGRPVVAIERDERRSQKSSTRRRLGRARLSCHTEASVAVTPDAKRSTAVTTSSMPRGRGSSYVCADDLDLGRRTSQHVDVVDRVLEQRARAGLVDLRRHVDRSGPGSG